ncbi:MAG: transporter substrate-binding domain-containing protein, partial [Oscillospiraceae bacterium]|nr:transporter substrate-binding domain-containing protein [Oscillospiraceae bacterium]
SQEAADAAEGEDAQAEEPAEEAEDSQAEAASPTAAFLDAKLVAEGGSSGAECIVADEYLSQAEFVEADSLQYSLMEVAASTADVAVVDSTMAYYLVGKGVYEDLSVVPDIVLSSEELAIGFRTGSNAVAQVNAALDELKADGTLQAIADKYGLGDVVIDWSDQDAANEESADEDDFAFIKDKGTMVIGITDYEPMNYYAEDGSITGFDTDLAVAVCEKLGVTPEFVEIDWDNKEIELNSKNIDCIWNGFTYTPERDENMDFSYHYMYNQIVMVVRTADLDKYTPAA